MSLLELLVVLVIVSLISTALVQGLGFGLSLYHRIVDSEVERSERLRTEEWFRLTNAGLVAQKDPGESLKGDKKVFHAYSMNPLLLDRSIVLPITWDISEGQLRYKEGEGEFLPMRFVGYTSEFRYRDESGRWHSSWPLSDDSLALPRAIRILAQDGNVTASIRMRRVPNLMLEESRKDRG